MVKLPNNIAIQLGKRETTKKSPVLPASTRVLGCHVIIYFLISLPGQGHVPESTVHGC